MIEVTYFELRKEWSLQALLPSDKSSFVSFTRLFLSHLNSNSVNTISKPLTLVHSK